MSSKIRIKLGDLEIEFEGSEEFLKQELPQLLELAVDLGKKLGGAQKAIETRNLGTGSSGSGGRAFPEITTNGIAAKLQAKSGYELLRAAAAHLALVKKTEPFSRQQLLGEMQSATSYYKGTYSKNLSKYIKSALQKDGCLSETSKNQFALTAAARAELEKTLADN